MSNFNTDKLIRGFKEYSQKFNNVLLKALNLAGDALLKDSTGIVPFQRGFSGGLASTASKKDPEKHGETVEIQVGYNKTYAARLHEDMSLNISQKNAGKGGRRQQKYIEIPMKKNGKNYGRIIANNLSKIK